jgi:hypothetical protein
MPDLREPKNTMIFFYGMIASFALLLALLLLMYYFDRVKQEEFHVKVELAPTPEREALRDYEKQSLNQYGFVDRAKGTVRIPIDRAIELETVQSWRQKAHLSGEAPLLKTKDGGTSHGAHR